MPILDNEFPCWMKEKIGFWCPGDIDIAIQRLINKGVYEDKSKAITDLLRQSLQTDSQLSQATKERLKKLCDLLHRTPEVVIQQCVEGILDMIDGRERQPLILEEVALRKSHQIKHHSPLSKEF